ncbi:MAG TPA: TetR/AcrR family transcriptional regulator C-terminal domain-containing protein [Patescibacteria group bacterium]|nr:TetR/AcrR family transcriptional regulator C-terminal domain-containing protein [Patescibacteria group bacterium]
MPDPAPVTPSRSKHERGLERQQIVQAALSLLDEVGYSGLTLRKLAAKLDVKAAALYWHFENKQDLIDAMAHSMIIGEFEAVTPKSLEWQELLADIARIHRSALKRYRDGAQIMAHANMAQSDMLEGMEFVLSQLHKQGFPPDLAMLGFFVVIRYTLGCVFEEQADPRHQYSDQAHKRHLKFVATLAERYPATATSITALYKQAEQQPDAHFELGLQIIISGIKQRLDASPHLA